MGSEMQPVVMRAQKRKIQISRVKKILQVFSVKKYSFSSFYMELKVFFTIIQQTYSKTCYKFYEWKVFLRIHNTCFFMPNIVVFVKKCLGQ
jgi:hypothetical protein